MARYRHVDFSPCRLPVDLQTQIAPGTFTHALDRLIDSLDLLEFDAIYRNEDEGAPALPPAVLLKAVLLGYSQRNHGHLPKSCTPTISLRDWSGT